jgi:hypothetical protein
MSDIKFIDLINFQKSAVEQIASDLLKLKARKEKNGALSTLDQKEHDRLAKLKADAKYVDQLFVNARAAFSKESDLQFEQEEGMLEFPSGMTGPETDTQTARVAYVLGLLQMHGARLPKLVIKSGKVEPDEDDRNNAKFAEAFYQAVGRATGNIELAKRVLKILAEAVDVPGDRQKPMISSLEYAKVVDKLIDRGVSAKDPNLKRHVDDCLSRVQGTGDDKPEHEIPIELPDLESITDYQVVEDNIKLMGPMIFASMFDELKAFQVVERLIEMSQRGELTLTKGKAGTRLYKYWREAPNRMSELERQTFYAMTLGIPTGQPGVAVNRDFQDLWIRFVSSVTALVRENRVDQILRSALPVAKNQQLVKKAARDLAANMSLHGYGMAYYAAIDLQTQINEMIELLQDAELRAAFGARDMWGVIDQVAQLELGGARNSSKYRMLATSAAIITRWLANNVDRLRDPTRPMIDLKVVENPPERPSGQSPTSHPTDYDLVNACELWLADTAMSEQRIEELAQPRESPQQPGRPIQIPSIARDLLEGTGLGFEMGANGARGAARGNGRAKPASYVGY